MFILIFIIWIGSAILCSIIAKKKNRDSFVWGAVGFLFGIFALIVIMVLSPLKKQDKESTLETAPSELKDSTIIQNKNEISVSMTKSDKKYFAILILATILAVLVFHFTLNPNVFS